MVETVYDLLSGKAAIAACHRAMVRHGRVVPIQAQVTIELTGRMLPGTEIGAAITALSPLGVDLIGLNCATGPVEMYEPLRQLSETAPMPLACLPNAGRIRCPGRGRLLRHDARAPRSSRGGSAAPAGGVTHAGARSLGGVDLFGDELPAGPLRAAGR